MGLIDVIIISLIALWVGFSIFYIIKSKKKGHSCTGCCSGCSSCKNCEKTISKHK